MPAHAITFGLLMNCNGEELDRLLNLLVKTVELSSIKFSLALVANNVKHKVI